MTDDKPRPVATSPDESRYVARLEGEVEFLRGQIAVKDTQIGELTERARETNHLIAGITVTVHVIDSSEPLWLARQDRAGVKSSQA